MLDSQEDEVIVPDDAPDSPAFGNPRAVVLRWNVPLEFDGTRADVYLSTKVGRLSRVRAARIIRRGDFRLPTGPLKPSSRVHVGPIELWRIPPDEPEDFGAEPGIIVDDADLIVVDKPPDLAVHPSARYLFRTLTAWLKRRAAETDERIAHPCHRLDRETSGVLVCAKTSASEREAKMAFMHQRARKVYVAVVRGVLDSPCLIDAPLALQGERGLVRIRMIVDDEGQEARTRVEPLLHSHERTLVACFPETGRQHQIRAHLAHIGFPLVGDKLYAMGDVYFDRFTRTGVLPDDGLDHHRHALHALALRLPFASGARMFVAPFPDELRRLLDGVASTAIDDALQTAQVRAFEDADEGSREPA